MRTGWLLVLAMAACRSTDDPVVPGQDATTPSADASPADADTRDLAERLETLPGVTAVERPCDFGAQRCFELTFEQPVDHVLLDGTTLQQHVTLAHVGFDRPMVALTTGYWDFYGDYPYELSQLLGANQISIEHRFFGSSRPQDPDWSKLTIQQSAADQHRITELLQTIYGQPWLTTGASKGGMTASYHRRFYPSDVAGTVPYVAPLSLAQGDPRYATFIDGIGTAACRQALRDVVVELLEPARFEAMVTRAAARAEQTGATYTRVALRPSVESSIVGIEWAFWQYRGIARCGEVPPRTASDSALWAFLDNVNAVGNDADLDAFDAYYYQASYELGYPDDGTADYVTGLTRYGGDDYAGSFPQGTPFPEFRAAVMPDIADYMANDASRFLFVYGEYDPWTGGLYELGNAADSQRSIAPQATHAAGLVDLLPADKAAAYERLERWTGVAPDEARVRRTPLPPLALPRMPPALRRALAKR